MRNLRISPYVALVSLFLSAATALPLAASQQARIVAPIDEKNLVSLKGNVSSQAREEFDQGEANPSTPLTKMRLVLSRTPEQDAALNTYLAQLQDKSSPNYHKWLTPEQFGARYGASDADIAVLVSWLGSHGLKLESVSSGKSNIAFSATVGQVEEAFHMSIHSFSRNGEQFYSNTTEPQIPAALAGVVQGIAHLNTIKPKPMLVHGKSGRMNPDTRRLEPVATPDSKGPRANLTLGSGTSSDPYFLYMVPGDAATIYDTPSTKFNANFSSGTAYDGAGVTIGIGGDGVIKTATVANYRTTFLGNSTIPTVTNVDGTTSTSNTDEAYIDNELSGGMAPGAAIHYYIDSNDLGIEKMLSDNTVDIFSLSFGECELDLSTTDNLQIKNWWQQAAGQGIAVTVSTGDTGSAACDNSATSNGTTITDAVGGLAVSGFASTPFNIAVGGTDFNKLSTDFATYIGTSQGSSSTYFRTAKTYTPESTWNDSTALNTTISANIPWTAESGDASYANIVAGAGGKSNCSTNTTVDTTNMYTVGKCTSGYAKPTWQTGVGVPSDSARDLPDVSMMAGNGFDSATWLICDDGTASNNTSTMNCAASSGGEFYFDGYGGTSTAAPAFAGILAMVEQSTGGRLGQAANTLYQLYNGSHGSAIFHDTTTGNNSVPCTTGTANCTLNTAGYDYLTGYNTGAGYDLATGLGSVDANALITYWSSAATKATPTVTVTPDASTEVSTTAFDVAVTVAGNAGTATGTVTLSGGGYTSGAQTLASGASTFAIAAGALTVGTDTLTVSYSGDTNYNGASGDTSVIITAPVNPDATYMLTAANPPAAVAAGATAVGMVTVNAVDGYTGTVTYACALSTGPTNTTADTPICEFNTAAVAMGSPTNFNIVTEAPTTSELKFPALGGKGSGWAGAGSGAVLALLMFFGIPSRRRSWRAMLSMLIALAALGSLAACGGGGGGGNKTTDPGSASGTYVYQVTATPSVAVATPVAPVQFSVIIN